MIRLLLFILILFSSEFAAAQNWSIGLKGDFTRSKLVGEATDTDQIFRGFTDYDFDDGYSVGLFVEKNLINGFHLQSRFSYTNITTSIDISLEELLRPIFPLAPQLTGVQHESVTGAFIEADVLGLLKQELAPRLSINYFVGLSGGMLLEADAKSETRNSNIPQLPDLLEASEDVTTEVENIFDLRPAIGIGLEYDRYAFDIIYKHGVTNFVGENDDLRAENIQGRYVSFGIRYSIFRRD